MGKVWGCQINTTHLNLFLFSGFVVMKLTGTKSRSTKFHTAKSVGSSVSFLKSRSSAGTLTLLPGRYAVIPCTSQQDKEGSFCLEIYADKVLAMENNGQGQAEADDEESDDEELGPNEPADLAEGTCYEEYENSGFEDEDPSRGLQSMMRMVSDLVGKVNGVKGEVDALEKRCEEAENTLNARNA